MSLLLKISAFLLTVYGSHDIKKSDSLKEEPLEGHIVFCLSTPEQNLQIL